MEKTLESNEISKFEDFFHDGSIDHIEQIGNNIYMWMESAQLKPEWISEFQVRVNEDLRIKGVLHLINVKSIIVNEVVCNEYKPKFELSDILDLYVSETQISLLVIWRNRSPDDNTEEWQKVIIEAERVFWRYDEYVNDPPEVAFQSSYKPFEMESDDGPK